MADETYWAAVAAELALVPAASSTLVLEASTDRPFDASAAIEKADSINKSWVIEIPLIGAVLEEFAKRQDVSVFALDEVPESLFATTEALLPGKCSVLVANGVIGTRLEPMLPEAANTISKVLKTAEERYVLGVVLVPEVEDSQGDVYSHAEVRKAAHAFMEHAGSLGQQHREMVGRDKLRILESYIVPMDFEQDGQTVTKGTWLMGIRVVDDALWGGVKKGDFTGFSIGGHAYRRPEQH